MKSINNCIICLLSGIITLTSCGKKQDDAGTKQNISTGNTTISFMHFGTPMEKKALSEMVGNFEKKFPNINIEQLSVPDESYNAKMATLVASGNTPDVAYLNGEQLFPLAQAGKIRFLSDMIKTDKEYNSDDMLDIGKYYMGDDLIAMSTAMEIVVLFYNKDIFNKAGIEYPPDVTENAWTWDKFVEVAKKLTIDRNGKHPDEQGFDPSAIKQYGVSFPTTWLYYMPFVWSNGGDLATPDGKDTLIDKPEFYEVIQKISDLINKYHVAPNPAQRKNMSIDIALMTGQVAMAVGGQWSLLDLSKTKVSLGIGVLPKFLEPVTMTAGAPTVIFNSTKNPEEAWELYKYHNTVEMSPTLFCNGLWMPMEKKYYTSPEYIKMWTDNSAHPKEYKTAVIDYLLKAARPAPGNSLKNLDKITEMLTAALDNVWFGNESAEHAMKNLAPKIRPQFQGRYSMKNVHGKN